MCCGGEGSEEEEEEEGRRLVGGDWDGSLGVGVALVLTPLWTSSYSSVDVETVLRERVRRSAPPRC